MLSLYAQHFDTVELNNTFYRLPGENGLHHWRESTPPGFCFAAKGSRFITHMKKLSEPEAAVAKFFERVDLLGAKLGPIVFQLPPWWEVNLERLENFLKALPRGHSYAFELRNFSWHTQDVVKLLQRHQAAFCIFDIAGQQSDYLVTADFTYVRLHGPGGAYQGSYSAQALEKWAARILQWRKELRAVYVYFDNDQEAYAIHNALHLKQLLGMHVTAQSGPDKDLQLHLNQGRISHAELGSV
jgi:uncharacterized protein YecE (DUF72 family)